MEPGPSRKRRKGGTQQRQQQALEQQSCQSELHDLLMLLLAQGLLSAVMVHRIANAAVKDIAKARDGYWAPDGENLQKSLDTRLAKIPSMPRPMDVDIPLKGQVPDIPSSSVLLPHEMLHAMY